MTIEEAKKIADDENDPHQPEAIWAVASHYLANSSERDISQAKIWMEKGADKGHLNCLRGMAALTLLGTRSLEHKFNSPDPTDAYISRELYIEDAVRILRWGEELNSRVKPKYRFDLNEVYINLIECEGYLAALSEREQALERYRNIRSYYPRISIPVKDQAKQYYFRAAWEIGEYEEATVIARDILSARDSSMGNHAYYLMGSVIVNAYLHGIHLPGNYNEAKRYTIMIRELAETSEEKAFVAKILDGSMIAELKGDRDDDTEQPSWFSRLLNPFHKK